MPHRIVGATPAQFLLTFGQLSMWLNDVDGDCVTAEEAAAKATNSPPIFITDATVQAWATTGGFLNGADLITVLDLMETAGFSQDGNQYDDGSPVSVDWTNRATLTNAIAQGPVKIGIAADQLENVCNAVAGFPKNGWLATGFTSDPNEDHCTALWGYGPIAWLLEQLGGTLPASVDGTAFGYALFTWGSVGVIDEPSMLAITGEAWLRNPTTIVKTS